MTRFSRFLFLAFGLYSVAFGQLVSPVYQQFTEKEGLGYNTIYNLFQDKEGFIWIHTAKGVERFDGKDFYQGTLPEYTGDHLIQLFNKETLFTLSEELANRSFGVTDSTQRTKLVKAIQEARVNSFFHSFAVDERGHIWFTVSNQIGLKDPKNRYTTVFELSRDTLLAHDLRKDPAAGQLGAQCYWKVINGSVVFTGRTIDKLLEPKKRKLSGPVPFDPLSFQGHVKRMIRLRDGSFLATNSSNLIHFKDSTTYFFGNHLLPDNIIDLYEDSKGTVWISTYGGAYAIKDQDFHDRNNYQTYLTAHAITAFWKIKVAYSWFGTKNNGIFRMIGKDSEWIRWQDKGRKNIIYTIYPQDDRIWFSAEDGHLYYLDSTHHIVQHPVPRVKTGFWMNQVGDQLITSYRYAINGQQWRRIKSLKGEPGNAVVGYFFHIVVPKNDHSFWMANRNRGFFEIDLDKHEMVYDSRDDGFGGGVSGMTRSPEGDLWLAQRGDIWRYKDALISHPYDEFPDLEWLDDSLDLILINFSDSGKVFIVAQNAGIIILDKEGYHMLKAGKELPQARSWGLDIIDDQSFWVFAADLYMRFEFDPQQKKYVMENSFDPNKIMPFAQRHYVTRIKDRFWVATDNGIANFNPDQILAEKEESAATYFSYLESKDSIYYPEQPIHLSHQENNLSIHFRAVSLLTRDQLTFRYRIPGIDPDWEQTTQTQVRYTNLDPGSYTFELESSDSQGNFHNQIHTLSFEIVPHVSQTLWFLLLMGLLALFVLILVVKQIISYFIRQNDNKRQLTELKYQALIGQMSPHFIFNALNSISYLIKNQQSNLANSYLSRFGGLLRGVLEHTQHTFVPLSEEVEHLQHYLELERLQMGDLLEIDFYVDPQLLEKEVYVPPMLFQPTIENALKHGIGPKGKGVLLVHFIESGEQILAAIRDDGIGREAASKQSKTYISKKKHSIGLQNTQERIATIKRMYNVDIGMQIEDLKDQGQSLGTHVEFHFPKLHQAPRQVANHPILDRISRL